jgi:hypothetical protein
VVIEALILGTPVASTRCPGGIPEILTGPLAKGLADLNSPALAQAMQSIYTNPPIIEQAALEKFSVETICQQYRQLQRLTGPYRYRIFYESNPLLSIVVAVYNGGKFLAQFFECIEQQQLESYELILVNDGSTDNSLAVIDAWRDRMQNVTLIQQENQGVSVARNSGLAVARQIPDLPGH